MRKNYYDDKMVTEMLLEYQSIVETTTDAKNHKIVINKTPRVEELETKITSEILKIVKAIIFLYRYDKHMAYDELEALGIMACFQNYLKFNPASGSTFNFFSLIVKKCLYGVTTRDSKKKKRIVYLEDLGDAVHASKEFNIEAFVDNLKASLVDIVDSHYLGKTRKRYNMITDIICDYIRKTKAYISKTDLYRFCGNYSLRASDIRAYVKDLKQYFENISEIIDVDSSESIDGVDDEFIEE